ncbi:hypothetical protein A0056_004275 [Campylobacter jejuni]|nr:hypothetical protein A0056_004275 [Campylobacter jejuni]SUX00446.1 Uncharacterised protein [Campylobacter jejuni subsp. doylei]
MIKYDANLLSLAKPEEGVLTAAGKGLKSASDWYWESRLNQVKERLANEQANGVEINNDFAKKNNAINLKRNELRFFSDSIKNQQEQINLGIMMQTQPYAIAKAAADAKEAQSRASYADEINQSQVNQIKANTANTWADTNAKNFQHEENKKNLDAFYSYGVPALMEASKLLFGDVFKKPQDKVQDYDKIINDPNTPIENKNLASAEKEEIMRALPGAMKEMSNLANIHYKQSRADRNDSESINLGTKKIQVSKPTSDIYLASADMLQNAYNIIKNEPFWANGRLAQGFNSVGNMLWGFGGTSKQNAYYRWTDLFNASVAGLNGKINGNKFKNVNNLYMQTIRDPRESTSNEDNVKQAIKSNLLKSKRLMEETLNMDYNNQKYTEDFNGIRNQYIGEANAIIKMIDKIPLNDLDKQYLKRFDNNKKSEYQQDSIEFLKPKKYY